jgi:hypothetical protein
MHSDRLQLALYRLEARRIEIERQIIAELESEFTATGDHGPGGSMTSPVPGSALESFPGEDHPTANDTHATFLWSD